MKRILFAVGLLLAAVLLLAACGGAVQFKLNFIVDGEVYATIDTAGKEAIKMPEDPTKEGDTFDGWYWDKDTWQKPFTANSLLDAPLSSNMNVYAKWESDGVAINASAFTINGKNLSISVSNDTETFSFGGQINIGEGDTWQISTDIYGMNTIPSKTVPLNVGDNTFYLIVTTGNNVDLYTVNIHRRQIYTVTFLSNGGDMFSSQQVEEDSFVTKPTVNPECRDYIFVNWNFDFSMPITRNTVISAAWDPISYAITYDLAGGTLTQTPNPTTYNVESGRIVFTGTPTKENYTFAGWSPSSIPNGSRGDQTVTARWTPTAYTITYNLNGGTNSASNPKTYTIESDTIIFANPTRDGYNFAGWDVSTIPHGSTGNKTITARWSEPIVYTISYDLAGGTMEENQNPTQYTVETPTFTIAGTPRRDNYNFSGWNIPTITKGSYGNKNITAQWTPISYTITYDLNGGKNAVNNPKTYTVESNTITLSDASRAGYDFIGWTWNGQDEPQKAPIIEHGTSGEKTFTANWSDPIIYSITYNLAGGTMEKNPNPIEYTVESENIAIEGTPTRVGYIFAGWVPPVIIKGSYGDKIITAKWDAVFNISENTITGVTKTGKLLATIDIPNEIDGVSITKIGEWAFQNCTSLTSITIPNSISNIGNYAFWGCNGLINIEIPNSVINVGNGAFGGCSNLTSITVPFLKECFGFFFGASSWNNNPDYVPSSLKTVIITGGSSITDWMFWGCSALESITIPNSVISIGPSAFYGCSGLTSITIPNSVTNIDSLAFYGCSNLTSITIGASVLNIGNFAFSHCNHLESIIVESENIIYHSTGNCLIETKRKTLIAGCKNSIIPTDGSVTRIGKYAFYECNSLTSITIPNSVIIIGENAFYECSNLTSIIYQGTQTEWQIIRKDSCGLETGNYVVHCTDGNITE